MRVLQWRPLALLAIGIANVFAWYGLGFRNWKESWSIVVLVVLALAAGFCVQGRTILTVVLLTIPLLFVGNYYHTRPLDWLLAATMDPKQIPFLLYYVTTYFGPLIMIYWALVKAGTVLHYWLSSGR